MNRDDTWVSNFTALKTYVAENGHFPSKHTRLNSWCRYQRKRIKAGVIPEVQRRLFEDVANSRGRTKSNNIINEKDTNTKLRNIPFSPPNMSEAEILEVAEARSIVLSEWFKKVGTYSMLYVVPIIFDVKVFVMTEIQYLCY